MSSKLAYFSRNFSRPHFSREMSRKTISRSREKCEKCACLFKSFLFSKACFSKNSVKTTFSLIIRHAHFSHFSREREMVLRDISREKCGREKLREKSTIFGQFWAQFDQNLGFFQGKLLPCELKLLYQMILLDFFEVVLRFIAYFDLTKKLLEKIDQI